MNYTNLNNLLTPLITNSSSNFESWASISIKGTNYSNFLININSLLSFLKQSNCENYLKINIDGEIVKEEEIKDYLTSSQSWELTLNKSGFSFVANDTFNSFFFLSSSSFIKWIAQFNCFDNENPFNKYELLRVTVFDLKDPIFSSKTEIIPLSLTSSLSIKKEFILPSFEKIAESIRVLSFSEITINLNSFVLLNGDVENDISKAIRKHAIVLLSASLVGDFYNESKVTIDGYRKLTLKLYDNSADFSFKTLFNLCEVTEWVYQEKTSTRKKLISDRLSIDLLETESFLKGLNLSLQNAFSQAQYRYNFIILERKDLYLKEVKDLLKDVKGQSDLYSTKIRTLLSNLLRDSLAALFLVGFTIFTKFSDNMLLDKIKLLDFVFNGLAIYYIVSIVFQIVIDIIDIRVSKNELLYWKNSSRELLPEEEFNTHIKESLKGRRNSLYFIYPLIITSYLLIALCCYKFPNYFKQIELSNQQKDSLIELPKIQKDSLLQIK
jgi:hypothetical protein